jgi:hypothetical protein
LRREKKTSIFHTLVWDGGSLRIFFEAIICVLAFQTLFHGVLNEELRQYFVLNFALITLIVASMIFFDQTVLCASLLKWEKSFFSAISGEITTAKNQLDSVLKSRFQPPLQMFYLKQAELFFMEGDVDSGEEALASAINHGAISDDCELTKLRGNLFSKDCNNHVEIDKVVFEGHGPLVYLESAMINLFRRNNYRVASEQMNLAMFMPPVLHPSLASSYDLCHLLKLCLGLHTGKAEDSLSQLSGLLEFLKFQISSSPGLRPYLSYAYLERAKYYSRRNKTVDKASADLDLALAICRYPAHVQIATQISSLIRGS